METAIDEPKLRSECIPIGAVKFCEITNLTVSSGRQKGTTDVNIGILNRHRANGHCAVEGLSLHTAAERKPVCAVPSGDPTGGDSSGRRKRAPCVNLAFRGGDGQDRSEEHTSELQSRFGISYV